MLGTALTRRAIGYGNVTMALSFAKFFGGVRSDPPCLPQGLRIYAVGDIHGRCDLFDALSELIQKDLEDSRSEVLTIFLGDYIDRGPRSNDVLQKLSAGDFPTPFVALRGNHEEVALNFLQDENVLESWRKFGGLETLHSYGVAVGDVLKGKGYAVAKDKFSERLPRMHRSFLADTRLSASYGDYFFCHAGIRPGVPLDDQGSDDLLWIRDEFLQYSGKHEKFIVHGHTPVDQPDMRQNRVNLDTGAFATSRLTALVLEGTDRRFLVATCS